MERFRLVPTRWGLFTMVARGKLLAATRLPVASAADALAEMRRAFPDAEPDDKIFPILARALRGHFAGRRTSFRIALDLTGCSVFQRAIIHAARRVAYGQTCAYGELAQRSGYPGAARAVGSVMRHNRFPLIVPCHRIIASGGGLGGFSSPGGCGEKRALLELEATAGSRSSASSDAERGNRRRVSSGA